MNKFDLLNVVTISDLAAQDKAMLIELILRADDNWQAWPSVQRLCMARGIKHEKNFKGADFYLPALVSKTKRGRKMIYTLDVKRIADLDKTEVTIKHTAQLNTPAQEGAFTPAGADNTPAGEGANTSKNTSLDTSLVADAPYEYLGSLNVNDFEGFSNSRETLALDYFSNSEGVVAVESVSTSHADTPAAEGVFESRTPEEWRGIKKERPLTKDEEAFLEARASAYMAKVHAAKAAAKGDEW